MKKEITQWEGACIITGYGVGGGVLSMRISSPRIRTFSTSIHRGSEISDLQPPTTAAFAIKRKKAPSPNS